MPSSSLSRRAFLQSASRGAGNSLLILTAPSIILAAQQAQAAMNNGQSLKTLDADEAAELEAIAARIIPTNDTPGAKEAGVIYFMDNVLGEQRAEILPALRKGLKDLQSVSNARYGSPMLHTLPDGTLDSMLREIEDTAFFNTVRYLTIAGMFTNPIHGGNQDKKGWRLIGFEDNHAWAPPFGHYDAEYMELGE